MNNAERALEISMADREMLQFYRERKKESRVWCYNLMQMQMWWLSILEKKKIDWGGGEVAQSGVGS